MEKNPRRALLSFLLAWSGANLALLSFLAVTSGKWVVPGVITFLVGYGLMLWLATEKLRNFLTGLLLFNIVFILLAALQTSKALPF